VPHDYRDFEDRPPPFNANLASEQGVDGTAGYSVPLAADQTVRGYKSTAVTVDGNGTAVSVEVGWKVEGDAAGIVTKETKSGGGTIPTTLLFVNQGQILDHVTLTGGANIDYSVTESNQLPLADAAIEADPWPMHQPINLGMVWELGQSSGGSSVVVDAATWTNSYFQLNGNGKLFSFAFKMGPKYARHEAVFTVHKSPDSGIVEYWIASLRPDLQSDLGATNPVALIQDRTTGTPAVNWLGPVLSIDRYKATVERNVVHGLNWRVSGDVGDDATAVGVDADGHPTINGGPGIYVIQVRVNGKSGLSSGYKAKFSQISVDRIDNIGFG
jgi:hypothetical protein